eukprot:760873-Amphidinium_carterae.3
MAIGENTGQRRSARRSRGFLRLSAARAFAQRKGLGRQRVVGARQVLAKEATVEAVNTAVNVADALTKPVAGTTMTRHPKIPKSMGFDFRQSWSTLHRRLKASKSETKP